MLDFLNEDRDLEADVKRLLGHDVLDQKLESALFVMRLYEDIHKPQ
jgi:hypothetical protein